MYQPNFKDPRVRARTQKVLDWALPMVAMDEPLLIDHGELTAVFGNQTSNALSKWLRGVLLVRIGFYDVDDPSLSYSVSRDGYEALLRAMSKS